MGSSIDLPPFSTHQIKCLFHRLRNGRNSVVEEKRILRDVKCAQEECEKSCGAVRTEKFVPWELHSKGSIKYQMEVRFLLKKLFLFFFFFLWLKVREASCFVGT